MATDNKYDRQLRLWGENGQRALATSKVCLLYAAPAGTETLKNLVLPGIGSITIVDHLKVSARDLGNNFFFEEQHFGLNRAAVNTTLSHSTGC